MERSTPAGAVRLWGAGFAAAALIQGFFPKFVADGTSWGRSPWQREVVIWNVGTLASILAMQRSESDPNRALVKGYTLLSALFSVNHLRAALGRPVIRNRSHWTAAAANSVAVVAGFTALSKPSRSNPSV